MSSSLAAGARLGPYRVIEPLGTGGMGEVYRARDTRLERDVAIKILPAQVAQDPDRQARFEREARAVAALSHPNILAIHDVGAHDGTTYAVTELLEGETLRQRLEAGAATPRKAVEIGTQIANGLAAAHDKGVVHRDLKPENVFITRDGRVKILDFGLAAQLPDRAAPDAATVAGGTEPGVILGTVGYMAPEQVRGARVDHRTDIFALGAVLFELLTGRRAFQRDTAAETMTAILKDDAPELSASGSYIPQGLDRIVRRCLEKNPDERMQSARDVAIALDAVSGSDVSSVRAAGQPGVTRRRSLYRVAAVAALVVAATAAGFLSARMLAPRSTPSELPRYTQLTFRRGEIRGARFTPDGQSVVYSAVWDSEPHRLYSVRLDNPRSAAPPIVDAALLAVSRSGDMAIATRPERRDTFMQLGTLAQIPLSGGAPREVLEHVSDATFSPDGRPAVVRAEGGRSRLEFPIGTVVYETAGWLSSPRFSPKGDRIAFHEHPLHDDDRGWPALVDVATKAKRNLMPEQASLSGLAWTPDGNEMCFGAVTAITCVAIQTQAVRVVVRGAPRLFLHDIHSDGRMLASAYTIRAAQAAGQVGGREMDVSWQDVAYPVDFSPDGKRLLFGDIGYGVNLRPLDGGPPVRLGDGIPAGFSADGRFVLALTPDVPTRIVVLPTGPGATRTLTRGVLETHTGAAWMPDGRHIVVSASESSHGSRLYLQNVDGGDPRPFTAEGVGLAPYVSRVVSPDGRFVIAIGPDQESALYPVDGGAPRPIPGLGQDLRPIGWGETSQSMFARARALARVCPVFKIDLSTGRRQTLAELGLRDPAGAPLALLPILAPDGRRYAYSVLQFAGDLFLIDAAPR
jgi:Tol biopolymer transport system component